MKRAPVWKTYAGLDRSIYVLFAAQVVNSIGHFVHPFLTLFLTQKLGLGAAQAGTYVFLSAMAWAPGSILGGKIADLTTAERRKAAYSLLYLGHNLGFALGPMIAGFLFTRFLSWIFLGDALTTAVAVLLIVLYVRESAPSDREVARSLAEDTGLERAERGSLLRVLARRPMLRAFLGIQILFSLVYSQTGFSLPLQLTAVFGPESARLYGVLISVNAVVVITLTTLVVNRTERVPPLLSIALAGGFFAVGFGMIGFLKTMPLLVISTVIWTIGEILQATNSMAFIANHSPMTHRGRFNALAPIIMGSGYALGPPLAGRLIEILSVEKIWPLAFALSILGSALLLVLFAVQQRRRRTSPPQSAGAPAKSRGIPETPPGSETPPGETIDLENHI